MSSPPSPNLIIYRGWFNPGLYVWSPFVIKLEARLRFANIPYKTAVGSVRTAPRGKIPYIEINDEGSSSCIGDSTLIIKHLIERNILADLNGKLSPANKTHDLALRALCEDKLYFYNTHERWTQNYYTMRDHILGAIPYPVRVIVGLLIYRGSVRTLHGQGTGRYSRAEIQMFRNEVWESLNGMLAAAQAEAKDGDDRPFWILGGDEPTEADATVFGFIVSGLICTAGPATRKLMLEFPAIREYAGRIHEAFFPDYEKWSEK
ncbi:hypothetical protein P175DRAFT_0433330 [Aspergillus ochraceoroseus IBT 24754]|uniref:Thioredoxin-like fold domain-containing protein n=2 Tax=Aspergillus ochraceoroseus TaxID=138278 RepID=A0A2T5M370_9EURO|nr:uncharacterized protein P175DRAFT_0433330 [Aspergillus ochraceoroseus IBT 24754]KKK12783.1 hypothetical protein AOCH_005087 [Aspergillus ochraceoroseus]PTU22988.1 hypothetical protein P175DRAFT_0433330 [Aspergillus ochraceoroseus IBT 24754]